MSWEIFDKLHHRYDEWFDESPGKEIFELEVQCLKESFRGTSEPWLEIGVGTEGLTSKFISSMIATISIGLIKD